MLSEDINYGTYLDGRFDQVSHVRAFGPWELLTGGMGTAPVLLLVNDEAHTATLCLYDTRDERDRDVTWVLGLPPGGEAGSDVFARLNPPPPSLAPGAARPLPEPSTDADDAPA